MHIASRARFRALPLGALTLAACDATAPDVATSEVAPSAESFHVRTYDAQTGETSGHRQAKVDVCHYVAGTDTYKLISVGAPALSAHLRHGDGVPGGEVPGADVLSVFDEDCAIVIVEEEEVIGGCTAERVMNGDGTMTVTVTAMLAEEERPIGLVSADYGAGSNGTDEYVRYPDLDLVRENGVYAGATHTATYLEGADDTVTLRVQSLSSELLTCGPYLVSQIPLSEGGV